MIKIRPMITAIILMLSTGSLHAAAQQHLVTMNIPQEVIGNGLQEILPLSFDDKSDKLEGKITIVKISDLRFHQGRIFCHLQLQGENLNLLTKVGDQNIRLVLGSADFDFDCDADLRYDAATQTLFFKPLVRDPQPAAAKEGDIGNALLLLFNGREFALPLQDIQPIITEAGSKTVTIQNSIANIAAVPGALQLKLQPSISATPVKEQKIQ